MEGKSIFSVLLIAVICTSSFESTTACCDGLCGHGKSKTVCVPVSGGVSLRGGLGLGCDDDLTGQLALRQKLSLDGGLGGLGSLRLSGGLCGLGGLGLSGGLGGLGLSGGLGGLGLSGGLGGLGLTAGLSGGLGGLGGLSGLSALGLLGGTSGLGYTLKLAKPENPTVTLKLAKPDAGKTSEINVRHYNVPSYPWNIYSGNTPNVLPSPYGSNGYLRLLNCLRGGSAGGVGPAEVVFPNGGSSGGIGPAEIVFPNGGGSGGMGPAEVVYPQTGNIVLPNRNPGLYCKCRTS